MVRSSILIGRAYRAHGFVANDEISVCTYVCDDGHFPYIQTIGTMIGYVNSNYDWVRIISEPQDAMHHSINNYLYF